MSTSRSKASVQESSPRQPVRDKVIVITGASSGLGLETARQLAGQGGEIVMIVRDLTGGEHARPKVSEAASWAGRRPVPRPSGPPPPLEPLSDSEIRVLRYLPTNLSAPEIANEQYVTANTVRTHVRHLYAKLGTHSRAVAVARARSLGLLAPSARRR
jgi:DNA-binding CsgD family transcriptional regulator